MYGARKVQAIKPKKNDVRIATDVLKKYDVDYVISSKDVLWFDDKTYPIEKVFENNDFAVFKVTNK